MNERRGAGEVRKAGMEEDEMKKGRGVGMMSKDGIDRKEDNEEMERYWRGEQGGDG